MSVRWWEWRDVVRRVGDDRRSEQREIGTGIEIGAGIVVVVNWIWDWI
jgi:hypothetical protein